MSCVVEVGLGGRLDASNTWDGDVAAITNVASTTWSTWATRSPAVAAEKAAIIKRGDRAVTGADGRGAGGHRGARSDVGVPLRDLPPARGPGHGPRRPGAARARGWASCACRLLGRHQAANAAVALGVVDRLAARRRRTGHRRSADRAGLAATRWPGTPGAAATLPACSVLLDGAHNPAGAAALWRPRWTSSGRPCRAGGPRCSWGPPRQGGGRHHRGPGGGTAAARRWRGGHASPGLRSCAVGGRARDGLGDRPGRTVSAAIDDAMRPSTRPSSGHVSRAAPSSSVARSTSSGTCAAACWSAGRMPAERPRPDPGAAAAAPRADQAPPRLRVRGLEMRFGERTYVMGILNVTPDSFSGDGLLRPGTARDLVRGHDRRSSRRAAAHGGRGRRPAGHRRRVDPARSRAGSEAEELARVVPVMRAIRAALPDVPLSVDTTQGGGRRGGPGGRRRPAQRRHRGHAGDGSIAGLAAARGVPYVLMHGRRAAASTGTSSAEVRRRPAVRPSSAPSPPAAARDRSSSIRASASARPRSRTWSCCATWPSCARWAGPCCWARAASRPSARVLGPARGGPAGGHARDDRAGHRSRRRHRARA